AMQKNIETLGFGFTEPLLNRLSTLSVEKAGVFYKALVNDLRQLVGAHREFKPMYPNFPEQVMNMSEAALYLNAWLHYLTNRLPEWQKTERSELEDEVKLRLIDLGTREEFESIFTKLAGAKTSLSASDKEIVVWFVSQYRDAIVNLMPKQIPQK